MFEGRCKDQSTGQCCLLSVVLKAGGGQVNKMTARKKNEKNALNNEWKGEFDIVKSKTWLSETEKLPEKRTELRW